MNDIMLITDPHIHVENNANDYYNVTLADFVGFQCDHDAGDSIFAISIIMMMVTMMMMMKMMIMMMIF